MDVYWIVQRQEQNLKTKRLEFLESQLLQLLQFSGVGWVPRTPGVLRRGQAALDGRGRGGARRTWAGDRGGARRAWAGRGLAAEAAPEAREIWTSSPRKNPRADWVAQELSPRGPSTSEPQYRLGDGGRTRLYSKWRENSGASAPGPGGEGRAGKRPAEPGRPGLASRSLAGCGLDPGEPLI